MVRVLGHRQTKGAATDNPNLRSPRHISTLPNLSRWTLDPGNVAPTVGLERDVGQQAAKSGRWNRQSDGLGAVIRGLR
jgi:hypothetical protein